MRRRAFLAAAAALAAPFRVPGEGGITVFKGRSVGPTMTYAEQMRWIRSQAQVASRLVPALRELQALGYRTNDNGVTWTKERTT